jgi:hypothetical protein
MWPISGSLDQLQTHVDNATVALGVLKELAAACLAACNQWAPRLSMLTGINAFSFLDSAL